MNRISHRYEEEREFRELLSTLREQRDRRLPKPLRVIGLCEGARNALFAALLEDEELVSKQTPALLIVPDEKEMVKAEASLRPLGHRPALYRFRDFVMYNITASHEFEHERLSVLHALLNGTVDVVITTPDALLQYTMPRSCLQTATRTVSVGDTVDLDDLRAFLVFAGYTATELVDGVGQFSVRGGILDVFPPGLDNPVRIELFGDDVDGMGYFDILSQRRSEPVETVCLTPAREILIREEALERVREAIRSLYKKSRDVHARDLLSAELDAALAGTDLRFADKYISAIYEEKVTLLDYFPPRSLVFCQELGACEERVRSYEWHQKQTVVTLLEEGLITPALADYGKGQADFLAAVATRPGVIADAFVSALGEIRVAGDFSIQNKQTVSYSDHFDLLMEDVATYKKNGYRLLLLAENEVMARNLLSMTAERDFPMTLFSSLDQASGEEECDGILSGVSLSGFELTASRFAVLSTCSAGTVNGSVQLGNRKRKGKKKSAQERIMSYADLQNGDYIVHVNHGIGMFLGIESVTVEGVTRDYIKIKYAGTDVLYLPCEQLDSISKYIGAKSEDGTLKLSRMGGSEWTRTKRQVKGAAKEMAKELIKLYAERSRRPGFAFLPDDDMQRDFEASFPFSETDGQLLAIRDVKRDMEAPRPMDRLLCGDVGFGKTEVALRAAFKAVESGKQVAFLVPTTILAFQHYQTFLSRLRGFPITVDMLSRFRSSKQQSETLRRIRRGEIDIVVGTHRMVSADVAFKDLGLVIIDEEQRFGVAAKEKLKQLSQGVDTLTLTATPIPRTLNMAMSGIRDMSVLEEAPMDRVPVQTYVLEYDEVILADAIQKELRRGGQVFYLHNRVESMQEIASRVAQMAPDAHIAVAHGKMDREELSDIWRSMLSGEIDILVSTTIIESGVDVPNANTLIIENADRLGLSQLHQIRGRVGRSSRRAYAYFTYPRGRVLTEVATKRLSAIRDYTEFGSGFKVALRDLEIRGAGNLLGSEQHGHIETVGYDLYMRLLNEAILEEKGEVVAPKTECTVDMNVSAYLPEGYVRQAVQRIDIYKKISLIENEEDFRDILDELLDRYGEPPKAVMSLLRVSLLRALGSRAGIIKIVKRGSSVLFYPEKLDLRAWSMLAADRKGSVLLSLDLKPYATLRLKANEDPLEKAGQLLAQYLTIVQAQENENKESQEKGTSL